MTENEISRHIVEAAIEVHRTLGGPGLLESVYEEAMAWELQQSGLGVERQVSLPIPYKGHTLASPLRIDLIVCGLVIVECKAVAQYNAIFESAGAHLSATHRDEVGHRPQLRRAPRQERHPSGCERIVIDGAQRKAAKAQRRKHCSD